MQRVILFFLFDDKLIRYICNAIEQVDGYNSFFGMLYT